MYMVMGPLPSMPPLSAVHPTLGSDYFLIFFWLLCIVVRLLLQVVIVCCCEAAALSPDMHVRQPEIRDSLPGHSVGEGERSMGLLRDRKFTWSIRTSRTGGWGGGG